MIDFRYHIVSLISVFLALAVGIALGAGPLKEQIGDTLTGQVSVLRAEKDDLRTELDTSNADLKDARDFLTAAGPELVGGKLADRHVAIVLLGEIDSAVVEATTAQLTQAGADVSAQVQVTGDWTDKNKSTFRESLAGSLVSYLHPAPAANAGSDTELAEALAQALTGADPNVPTQLSESASVMIQLLTEGKLISTTGDVTEPSDAIVILAGPIAAAGRTAATAPPSTVVSAYIALAQAAQSRSEGAVVVGGDPSLEGLVKEIRADGDAKNAVSTVSDGQEVVGQITVPLALNARIGGKNGHYGIGADLVPVPATVSLSPVNRTPVPVGGAAG